MLSLLVCPKVITLSGFYCIKKTSQAYVILRQYLYLAVIDRMTANTYSTNLRYIFGMIF